MKLLFQVAFVSIPNFLFIKGNKSDFLDDFLLQTISTVIKKI